MRYPFQAAWNTARNVLLTDCKFLLNTFSVIAPNILIIDPHSLRTFPAEASHAVPETLGFPIADPVDGQNELSTQQVYA